MKRIVVSVLLMMMALCQAGGLKAQQEIYVSLADGWDDWNSGVLSQPFKTIEKAITKAVTVGAKEVRIVAGEYHLNGELKIPANLSLVGGYKPKETVRVQNPAEQTIIVGDGRNRVATVAGVLDGVTVKGGFCKGGNGGGVLVKSTGRVVNCVVVENKATFQLPKIGDLLMKDGTFLDVNSFTYQRKDDVVGVIFWVNPDKGANIGAQGYAVAPDAFYGITWGKTNEAMNVTGTFYANTSEAVNDMDGRGNTDNLMRFPGCLAIQKCRERGPQWSLPALGQLMQLAAEWDVVQSAFGKLWEEMMKKPGINRTELRAFFGSKIEINNNYTDSQHFMTLSGGMLFSSTLKDKESVWRLADLSEKAVVGVVGRKDIANFLYVVEF